MTTSGYNGYSLANSYNSTYLTGSDAQPLNGTSAIRYGPYTNQLEVSNNGSSWQVIGSGASGSVAAGVNISINQVSGNDVISVVNVPTFSDINIGLNSVLSCINTVNSNINQAVLTSSSPSFAGMTVNGNISVTGTINTVNLLSLYNSYTSNVNQAVLTSSTPNFAGVNVSSVSALLYSAGYLRVGSSAISGLLFVNGISSATLDNLGFTTNTINGTNISASTLTCPLINTVTTLSLQIASTYKLVINNTLTANYNNFGIYPNSNGPLSLYLVNTAGYTTVQWDNTFGRAYYNCSIGGLAQYRAINIISSYQAVSGYTTGMVLGTSLTSNNSFDLNFSYAGSGSSSNSINITANSAIIPNLSIAANGYTNIGFSADALSLSQTYQYNTGNLYRSNYIRVNSGVAPGGRNRVEFFGINGSYNAVATDQSGFLKSFGYAFQQCITGLPGTYYNILDIDYSAVTIYPATPLCVNNITPSSSTNIYLSGSTSTISASASQFFVNNLNANYGIAINTIGGSSTGNSYIAPVSASTTINIQTYISGTASNAITLNTSGMYLNYCIIGTNYLGTPSGALRMSGTSLQYCDGTNWNTITAAGSNVITNTITTASGSAMYLQGSTAVSTSTSNFYFTSSTGNSSGYEISPVGSANATYTKTMQSGGSVYHQTWIGGTPTTVLTLDTNGLTANNFKLGSSGQYNQGGLMNSGTQMLYHNGTTYYPVQYSSSSGCQVSCGMSGGSPSHSLNFNSSGVSISNTSNANYFTINWPAPPTGYTRYTNIDINQMANGTQSNVRFLCTDSGASSQIQPSLNGSSQSWSAITSGQIQLTLVSTLMMS